MNKSQVDEFLLKYKIQPVGDGYIDLICPFSNVADFIDELTRLNIRIEGFTWWCHAAGDHKPCGMGGPRDRYGDGFYSEIAMDRICKFSTNDEVRNYLLHEWQESSDYKPCYVPAFWLDVD